MKMKTLSVLAGVGAPLILTATAQAGFLGIELVTKEVPLGIGIDGLLVCNIYAVFDNSSLDQNGIRNDHMNAVAGTPGSQLTYQVIGGTFYQNPFGPFANSAPNSGLFGLYPSLAFDTFLTIGAKAFGPGFPPGGDQMVFTPNFPSFGPSSLRVTNGAYAVNPTQNQGDPFDPQWAGGADGRVLIAQLSTLDGTGISGTMVVQYTSDGKGGQQKVSFLRVPSPGALAVLGAAYVWPRRPRSRTSRSGSRCAA